MFDMKQIGKKITNLRKAHNMTQMELADRLGISFQAVSNWERGSTMPDISKLPELAETFHTSVDELLNGKAPLVEAVINDTVKEYMEEGHVTAQEIADTLPLLKPEQAEDILEKTDMSSFTDLSLFLPYMDEESIGELAMAAAENGEDVSEFLPHMNSEDIGKVAIRAMENGILLKDCHEYMEEEDIGELAMLALEKGFPVDRFLEYMSEEDVGILAIRAMKNGTLLKGCLDYMHEEDVGELAMLALEKGFPVDKFLDYMNEEDVTKLALKALKLKKRQIK